MRLRRFNIEDLINHPSHYTDGKYEVLDVIEDWGFDYRTGNALKYISRFGKKAGADPLSDLLKAEFYINRAAERPCPTLRHGARTVDLYDYCADKGLSKSLTDCVDCLYHGNAHGALRFIREAASE